MPEFDLYFPVAGQLNNSTPSNAFIMSYGGAVYTVAVGFSFGNGSLESREAEAVAPRWP